MSFALLLPWPVTALAYGPATTFRHQEVPLLRKADSAHAALDPEAALEAVRAALAEDPDAYGALWRGAREAVSLGMLAPSADSSHALYVKAERFARHARSVDTAGVEAAEWLAISLGRRALSEGLRTRVHLAVEVRRVALETLRLDSLDAGAHHVLGEWNAEVERLSGIERWAARKLLGAHAFEEASWDRAVAQLRRAVELDPEGLVHHLDLARVYLDLHRMEPARAQLQEVLTRPVVQPADPLIKEQARKLLDRNRV